MLVAAACCPHPPLLVPEIARRSEPELDALRHACEEAVDALYRANPDRVEVVGAADTGHAVTRSAPGGSFARYGLDVTVDGAAEPVPPPDGERAATPLGLLVGGWLIRGRPAPPVRRGWIVGADTEPDQCMALGRRLAEGEQRVAMLVMGDGPPRAGFGDAGAPGAAERFDDAVERALRRADTAVLLALDEVSPVARQASGRAPWQVLAGAASTCRAIAATVGYVGAPFGVGYTVATWLVQQ